MKFGRNLPRNQVPEWASSYINYKALKKLIKNVAETSRVTGSADTAGKLPKIKVTHSPADDHSILLLAGQKP